MDANFAATQKEDMEAVKQTIHTQSPVYIPSLKTTEQLFGYYDLKVELLYFRYTGSDGEYAIARAKQKTIKVKGPAFKNNIIDSIYIFRKETGKWKIWQQSVLETKFIE